MGIEPEQHDAKCKNRSKSRSSRVSTRSTLHRATQSESGHVQTLHQNYNHSRSSPLLNFALQEMEEEKRHQHLRTQGPVQVQTHPYPRDPNSAGPCFSAQIHGPVQGLVVLHSTCTDDTASEQRSCPSCLAPLVADYAAQGWDGEGVRRRQRFWPAGLDCADVA